MPVIGLTGAIGSGKSTVARVFARHGARVIDADAVGHEMLRRGGPCFAALVDAFGADIVGPDGEIVRQALGARAFVTPADTARLNAIVHPPLVAEVQRRAATLSAPHRAVVVDAALLLEWGPPIAADRIVVVTAPLADRERRLAERTGLTAADLHRRAAAQWSEEDKVRRADIVIANDADVAALERRAEDAWRRLQRELDLEDETL